jgi:site-specific DNA recombinase
MNTPVALYARVSSEKQAQSNTIASQIAAIQSRINADGYTLLSEYQFIDNGYSGSHLVRPALEQLRDKVAAGEIDKIYVHSPDRLSRKYAHQMVLMEEFQRHGAQVIFLNHQPDDDPESQLLLQMQGMIAEYERAKIMERYRRGKLYAAKRGSINVLATAPYGYRYIDKFTGGGEARLEIHEEEAEIVRKIFDWIGRDRLSIGEVRRQLNQVHPYTRTGKTSWDKSSLWGILKNPAYIGQAAYGKTKIGNLLPRIRPRKNSYDQPKYNYSVFSVEKEKWIYIPVPLIIDKSLFDSVQEQLEENRKIARARHRGAVYLLQGLIVCQCCGYAFYGKPATNKYKAKRNRYAYYRCVGKDGNRFDGQKICNNKDIRTEVLDIAAWEEVKQLLKNPQRIINEYQRRMNEIEKSPLDTIYDSIEKQKLKLQRGISRLIDSYAQEDIDKNEFEPRIKALKQRLKSIEDQQKELIDQKNLKSELKLIITNVENFASCLQSKLENIDWHTKRKIIRTLVKRIEINHENVNIVFRINELVSPESKSHQKSSQHRWRRNFTSII